jgi:hypothetical protein
MNEVAEMKVKIEVLTRQRDDARYNVKVWRDILRKEGRLKNRWRNLARRLGDERRKAKRLAKISPMEYLRMLEEELKKVAYEPPTAS